MPMSQPQLLAALRAQSVCDAPPVALDLGPVRVRVHSNSEPLLRALADYFAFLPRIDGEVDLDIEAIETPAINLPVAFKAWPREPGKLGRKDECYELASARLIRKARTGMLFLQSQAALIAAGPCLKNLNQLVNFINSQAMNRLQHMGHLICHAAAVARADRGLMLAGLSGGGKSSLMLHLMEQASVDFISNDRVFVSPAPAQAWGTPKLPRINPGTLLSLPRLHGLASPEQRQRWAAMAHEELWGLEHKHDVPIHQLHGPDRVRSSAPLRHLIILNWSPVETAPCRIEPVDLRQRADLLAAVMKSPGPFYQDPDGVFLQQSTPPSAETYQAYLQTVDVHEARGRVDFAQAVDYARHLLD